MSMLIEIDGELVEVDEKDLPKLRSKLKGKTFADISTELTKKLEDALVAASCSSQTQIYHAPVPD